MHDELVELLKRPRIEQQRDAFSRRLLPLGMLPLDALLAAAKLALAFAAFQLFEIVLDHSVTFRSAAMRFIASVTSTSDGSRVPIDFASRIRASASMASYAAKLSSSVFVTTSMPISASPNSTRPRSSSRFTIDRARNSICRMLVGIRRRDSKASSPRRTNQLHTGTTAARR